MNKVILPVLLAIFCITITGCKPIEMQQSESSVTAQAMNIRADVLFSNGGVNISYPQFMEAESLNQKISDYVTELAETVSGGYYENTQAQIIYRLQTNSRELISILFEGEVQVGAGEVQEIKSSFNLDTSSGERLLLSDLTDIDDAFMQILSDHAEQTLDPQTAAEFRQNLQEIQQRLFLADSPQSRDFSYYADGTLNIFLEDWEGNRIFLQDISWDRWKLSAKRDLVSEQE